VSKLVRVIEPSTLYTHRLFSPFYISNSELSPISLNLFFVIQRFRSDSLVRLGWTGQKWTAILHVKGVIDKLIETQVSV
ncbi:MAG: hypothetical protein MI867_07710, partial [Pseudomonadales bacterium]|nr:hypothetical protein [Pseudomonadales bacterium]